jgi:hypothetical protein
MQSHGDDFKPIPAERGPVPHAACNYTKWPEVKLHDRTRRHPLALLGGVFYAARTLDEPWSTLTRHVGWVGNVDDEPTLA